MYHKLAVKVLNMFKNFMQIFLPKCVVQLPCDSHTFVQVSQTCRREILANLQFKNFVTLVRMLYNSCATVLQAPHLGNNIIRHSHECHTTTVARYIFKIRPKFTNLLQKCPVNKTVT